MDKNPFSHILYEMEMYLRACFQLIYHVFYNQYEINLAVDSRAIHIRNLACFFCTTKSNSYWNVNDYVNDSTSISQFSKADYDTIKEYASRATSHLLDYRLEEDYKKKTTECFDMAYPVVLKSIKEFLSALDTEVITDYQNDWKEERIQNYSLLIRQMAETLPEKIIDEA